AGDKLVSHTIATTIFCRLALILFRLLPFFIAGPSFPSLGPGGEVWWCTSSQSRWTLHRHLPKKDHKLRLLVQTTFAKNQLSCCNNNGSADGTEKMHQHFSRMAAAASTHKPDNWDVWHKIYSPVVSAGFGGFCLSSRYYGAVTLNVELAHC
ncbi:hypothetical protein F5887DRAFT_960584, partial [Amanita rubescens]